MSQVIHVSSINESSLPAAPDGWKYVNLVDPDKLESDPKHYPILVDGPYTYTALSDIQNTVSMLIIGFDEQKKIVKQLVKPGARYIWEITLDAAKKAVTFTGQARDSVHATLDELSVPGEVHVTTANESTFPHAPDGWKYTNLVNPDKLDSDPAHYPILVNGEYTYTALSKIDNIYEMLIIGWDVQGNIVKRLSKSGARYIWQITLDTSKQLVTFTGQSRDSVHATLAELKPDDYVHIATADKALFPPAPDGWKYTNLDDPDKLGGDPKHYPVLYVGPYTYTALSDTQNNFDMLIVGWDENKQIVKELKKPGARYIWEITFDSSTQVATFTGQARKAVHANIDELIPVNIARIGTSDEASFPQAPAGYKYTNLVDPEKLKNDPKHYPVLLFDSYTFTALSRIDNKDAMLLIGWNSAGTIVKQVEKSGARYIWRISLGTDGQSVTFTGQARESVRTTLQELTPNPSEVPRVGSLSTSLLPAAPSGWKYVDLVHPDQLQSDPTHYPVLFIGPYTYTALSDIHNEVDMLIIGWDSQKKILKQVKKSGARYIWQIVINPDNISFVGQARRTVYSTVAELKI